MLDLQNAKVMDLEQEELEKVTGGYAALSKQIAATQFFPGWGGSLPSPSIRGAWDWTIELIRREKRS